MTGRSGVPGAILAVLGATALVVFSTASVNVALPSLTRSFGAEPADVLRVTTVYQAALAAVLLPCAALGESLGLRRVFTAGLALFTGASLVAALAPSLEWLLLARGVQGIGGAAILALGVALMRRVIPQDRLAAAIGWNALTVALSSAAAPMLSTLLVALTGWHGLFLAHLVPGASLLAASRMLPAGQGNGRQIDLLAISLNVLLFAGFVGSVDAASTDPAWAAALASAACGSLVLLVRRELPKTSPLVPLDLLGIASFRRSVIASVCCFSGQTAGLIALPFLLHESFRLSFWQIGLWMTPWPLTVAACSPIAARLSDRLSVGHMCVAGGVGLTLGLTSIALWPSAGGVLPISASSAICGFAWGLFQVANNRNMYLAAPIERSAAAGGMQGTARLVGQLAGAMLVTLLFAHAVPEAASRKAIAAGALLTLLAGIISAAPEKGVTPMTPRGAPKAFEQ